MNPIHDVENKTFAELKVERAELLEALKGEPVEELAARFLQARMDAKQRDEKLAEQGKTITALQDGAEASKQQDAVRIERLGQRTAELAAVQDELKLVRDVAAEQKRTLDEQVKTLKARRAEETERANRLKTEALRNHAAVSQAAKLLNDALAANAVDKADESNA